MSSCCCKCGTHISALNEGIRLVRVNFKGESGIWECRPKCFHTGGTQESALLSALDDSISESDNEE